MSCSLVHFAHPRMHSANFNVPSASCSPSWQLSLPASHVFGGILCFLAIFRSHELIFLLLLLILTSKVKFIQVYRSNEAHTQAGWHLTFATFFGHMCNTHMWTVPLASVKVAQRNRAILKDFIVGHFLCASREERKGKEFDSIWSTYLSPRWMLAPVDASGEVEWINISNLKTPWRLRFSFCLGTCFYVTK